MASPQLNALINRAKFEGRTRRRRKTPEARLPLGISRDYLSFLLKRLRTLQDVTNQFLDLQLPAILDNAQLNSDSVRHDAVEDVIEALFEAIAAAFRTQEQPAEAGGVLLELGEVASAANVQSGRETSRVLKSKLGFDLFTQAPDLSERLGVFVRQNVKLIKSLENDTLDQLEQTMLRHLRRGSSQREIRKDLQSRFDLSKSRASLIARDQVGKFFGELQRERQKSLGITEYIWRTASDERVRSTHQDRDGRKFKWSEPPSDGHPGEPIRCRCTAEPVIPGFTEED